MQHYINTCSTLQFVSGPIDLITIHLIPVNSQYITQEIGCCFYKFGHSGMFAIVANNPPQSSQLWNLTETFPKMVWAIVIASLVITIAAMSIITYGGSRRKPFSEVTKEVSRFNEFKFFNTIFL